MNLFNFKIYNRIFYLLLVINSVFISSLYAADNNSLDLFDSGVVYYNAGQFTDAESMFSQANGYMARLAQAISSYQLKNINKAISLFKQSVLLADTDDQRYLSLYNAATCSFISGDYTSSTKLFLDAGRYRPGDTNANQFYEISLYLEKLVLAQRARMNAKSNKKKSSEGKKTISLDIKFDDDINLRLEDDESSDLKTKNIRQLLLSDRALLNNLITNGINSLITNDTNSLYRASFVDKDIKFEFSLLDNASYTPEASGSDLWKRIFELEQGFPASLEKAERLPGVRQW